MAKDDTMIMPNLLQATLNNDISELNRLIDGKADVNITDRKLNTALHIACAFNHHAAVKLLLKNNANANAEDYKKATPLTLAINNNIESLKLLLEYGANTQAKYDENKHNVIHILCLVEDFNPQVLGLLIQYNADINALNSEGFTPLMCAIELGKNAVAKSLIEHKADIEIGNLSGNSALHLASFYNNIEIAKLLIDNKANVNAVNPNNNKTALHIACENNNDEAVKLLLENKADANVVSNDKITPLFIAFGKNSVDNVKLLLEHGADTQATYNNGGKIIHFFNFIKNLNVEILNLLIEYEADINAGNENGFTPLIYAIQSGNIKATQFLIDNNANISTLDNIDSTALHHACARGNFEAVKLLLVNKADVNAEDLRGNTPIKLAFSSNNISIINLLLSHMVNEDAINKNVTPLGTAEPIVSIFPIDLIKKALSNQSNHKQEAGVTDQATSQAANTDPVNDSLSSLLADHQIDESNDDVPFTGGTV